MVTYYLVNKSDEKLVYEYYPEDKKEFKPGIIIVDLVKDEIYLTKMAEDDSELFYPVDDINAIIKEINDSRIESGDTNLEEYITEPIRDTWYGNHAIRRIVKDLKADLIREKGCVMWY